MKVKLKLGLLFLMFCLLIPVSSRSQDVQSDTVEVKVISANIRVALKEDEQKGNGWEGRKELLFDVLKEHQPDILCLQEVLEVQNEDFKNAFPDFFSFGFEGPEMDAHDDDDYHGIAKNPILFSKEQFDLISGGTYWLSETPHIGGSKAWGTARARHVNWVRLKEKKTGKVFRVLNTHFDHVSEKAKMEQARMLIEESGQYPEDFPQILAGDFNVDMTEAPLQELRSSWTASYSQVHGEVDPGFTVHGFEGEQANTKRGKVDFIFYRGALRALDAEVLKDNRNGVYPSDHYFVSALLAL